MNEQIDSKFNINSSCYLCNKLKTKKIHGIVKQWPVSICTNCGFLTTENIDIQEIRKLYLEKDYYSDEGGSGFYLDDDGLKLEPGILKTYYKTRFLPINKHLNSREKIDYLDIGCSAGFMLQHAKDHGWNETGIDFSPVAVKFAKEKLGLNAYRSSFEEFNVVDKSYDVISMFHVLEYLEDPRGELLRIYSALKDNGLLVLEIPNAKSLAARIRKNSWKNYVLPYHLWHFNKDTLKILLNETGFEIDFCYTPYVVCQTAAIFNVHRGISNLRKKIFKRKKANVSIETSQGGSVMKSRKTLISKIKFMMVVGLYWPFDQLVSMFFLGENMFFICRKKMS